MLLGKVFVSIYLGQYIFVSIKFQENNNFKIY